MSISDALSVQNIHKVFAKNFFEAKRDGSFKVNIFAFKFRLLNQFKLKRLNQFKCKINVI